MVDNQLLFQRLLAIAGRDELELKSGLSYELNSQPASLFNKEGLMNDANKPALDGALSDLTGNSMPELPTSDVLNVLDGGDLLNKFPWKKDENIQQICHCYVEYVNRNYDSNVKVVFDGYPDEPTTKNTTHLKRDNG